MFPSSSSLPSVLRVPVPSSTAGVVMEAPDGSSVGRDAREALPPYFVRHYIVEFGPQLDSRRFRLMRFDGDQIHVQDEAGVARDAAV